MPDQQHRGAADVLATIRSLYATRYQVRVGDSLGFENTFAMVVRGSDAQRLHLQRLSDVIPIAPHWRLGVGYEFEERPDGLHGMEAAYNLHFGGAPKVMDLGLLYRSLASNGVDIVAGNSTDGPIRALGFVALADDRHYFPPYEAVPLVREDSLRRHPEIGEAVARLAGKITADEMRSMNDAVDAKHRDVGEVVRQFRRSKGL